MAGVPFRNSRPQALPCSTGIGLRAPHYRQILEDLPAVGWLEVHSENFFSLGGMPATVLERARADYPLSLHGVGLSLGSTDPLSKEHLRKLNALVSRYEPQLVSDHLCWSSVGWRYLNDLLPLPYTREALNLVAGNVQRAQEALGRRILIENVSSYLEFADSDIPEWEFLAELAARTGCGILLDVNNVYVSARNHGFDARDYLLGLPHRQVEEIHLAGHMVNAVDGGELLVDTHNQRVSSAVWALYREALELCGETPTLIEWDSDLPPLDVLLDEARLADACLASLREGGRYARAA